MKAEVILVSCLLITGSGELAAQQSETEPSQQVAAASAPVFDLLDFQIEGNTVLDDETLEHAVYPYLGPDKTVGDVEKARVSLEEAYRKAGYPTVVVAVPEQDVNTEGRVRITVVEGSIEILHVTGSRYHALSNIREAVPALAEGKVPHMPKVQEQVAALAQQTPDRNVTPIFRAGSTPGKMEVEMRVKDELPLHGSVEMNSRQSGNTPYSRLIGSIRYDNLWQMYHSASLQYQVAPEDSDRVSVLSGTYVMPTGWFDTKLAMYGISINSNTPLGATLGTTIGGTNVIGAGSIYGARLVKPILEGGNTINSFTAGFDYKSFDQTTSVLGKSPTAIQYASFMGGYDGIWRQPSFTTSLSLAGYFSIRGLGNDAEQFAKKRTNRAGESATPDYFYLTANLKHLQSLPWDFQFLARLQGQASSTFLISNESFSAGGPQSVRGYYQTQVLGDDGINLSMELHSPKLMPNDSDIMQNLRFLAFTDWAGVWFSNQSVAKNYAELGSTGLGMRMKMLKSITGELDWAYPLIACTVGCTTAAPVAAGQQRIDFRMLYEF